MNIIDYGDALEFYNEWKSPDVIISDGPYGISGYKGDATDSKDLYDMYEPHVKEWTKRARPGATLWFWNTELGWARVHSLLEKYGWEYKGTNIWNKGIGFVAGNVNTKTMSKFPVVSEICVQYVLPPKFEFMGEKLPEKEWLRKEWKRTGLPLSKTNEASGVKSAATRKYFTLDNLWYSPPAEAFEKLVSYANLFGDEKGKPYFTDENGIPYDAITWERIHPVFNLPLKWTNVWNIPQLSGKERIKIEGSGKSLHYNQKPLQLMNLILNTSAKSEFVLWEPFGGLASASVAAKTLGINSFAAEIQKEIYLVAKDRLDKSLKYKV